MPVSPEKMQKLKLFMERLDIKQADLEEKFTRGGGKGGQKVNKTNNKVCLTHVPTGIVVQCHCEREREINRYLARRTLCEELDHRLNGAPSPRQLELTRASKRGGKPRSCSITQRKMQG
ncbi:MAG: peptide chain release factor-like protein [Akkermansia sp.]|nr:peptide chain release factor-like protein [Akkermansia sp.]